MKPIDGDKLMMHLTDWWYSSFGQSETDESKAIKTVLDKIEQSLGVFAMEQDKWIPVTERLPSKESRYMVTRNDYVTNTEYIDILWYEKNIWWNGHSTGDYAVTAWMPLPEPYKGDL